MLLWVRRSLNPRASHGDAMMWAAIMLAYFFLLRASEYTAADQSGLDTGKGVRGIDLQAKRAGEAAGSFREADEVTLCIRGSKTDQLNRGEWRNHFRAKGQDECKLCVVEALEMYEHWVPERFRGVEQHERLFVWPSGRYLVRSEVQQVLCSSAVATGANPDDIGSHSLRIGGASALWAAYKDSALVRRWGRWSSDAFHGYLWEARSSAQGVSDAMAAADLTQV